MKSNLISNFFNKLVLVSFKQNSNLFSMDNDAAIEGIITDVDDKFLYLISPEFGNIKTAFSLDIIDVIQDAEILKVFNEKNLDDDIDFGDKDNTGNILN